MLLRRIFTTCGLCGRPWWGESLQRTQGKQAVRRQAQSQNRVLCTCPPGHRCSLLLVLEADPDLSAIAVGQEHCSLRCGCCLLCLCVERPSPPPAAVPLAPLGSVTDWEQPSLLLSLQHLSIAWPLAAEALSHEGRAAKVTGEERGSALKRRCWLSPHTLCSALSTGPL